MFDIFTQMFVDLVSYIPVIFALYVIFDLIGGLLFNKR